MRIGRRGRIVALGLVRDRCNIANDVVVHARGVRGRRALEVQDNGKRLVVDTDVCECVLCQVSAFGNNHRDGFAGIPDFPGGQWRVRRLVENKAGNRRCRYEER